MELCVFVMTIWCRDYFFQKKRPFLITKYVFVLLAKPNTQIRKYANCVVGILNFIFILPATRFFSLPHISLFLLPPHWYEQKSSEQCFESTDRERHVLSCLSGLRSRKDAEIIRLLVDDYDLPYTMRRIRVRTYKEELTRILNADDDSKDYLLIPFHKIKRDDREFWVCDQWTAWRYRLSTTITSITRCPISFSKWENLTKTRYAAF